MVEKQVWHGVCRGQAEFNPDVCATQNQTERCHPEETRPLTVREYARIQTSEFSRLTVLIV